MNTSMVATPNSMRVSVPVIALTFYAVASGYLMSLIPLMLPFYGLDTALAGWLASVFYAGLLIGAVAIEPILARIGHKNAFVWCLIAFMLTIIALPSLPYGSVWIVSRFIAGLAVAGIFVIVESWLLHGDERARAKRLGVYMAALYGGTSVGQFGIGILGISGAMPFIAIITSLFVAVMVLMFVRTEQPAHQHSNGFSLKSMSKLNHPALVGCLVSGLTLGALYGLMPLELSQKGIENQHIGSLMALIILGAMAVQPIVPWLSKLLGSTLLMAAFCLIGAAAATTAMLGTNLLDLSISLFVLGMALFALYPIAINLACKAVSADKIVSVTQVMLLSYSVGSVIGPVLGDMSMHSQHGLFGYLFAMLMATCIYMLISSAKRRHRAMAG
ncbi:Predicted arabinose efflux permease, MFS family [Vibrio xiamenensis]|uniref:Predicted arabinose efflux permease, MFS family n=1 Tax=Vibrio xiamenensis TaxID=861298 RepID=A0A1G8GZ03_9VIBR|nr:Predicted arabinose efflux permease, MFS family [Vibrio xiamenensis]